MDMLGTSTHVDIGITPLPVKSIQNGDNPKIERIHFGRPGSDVAVIISGEEAAILKTLRNLGVAVADAILRRSTDALLLVPTCPNGCSAHVIKAECPEHGSKVTMLHPVTA